LTTRKWKRNGHPEASQRLSPTAAGAMEMARQILGNIDSSDGNGAVGGRRMKAGSNEGKIIFFDGVTVMFYVCSACL
jgi:hypothetical protein